MRYPSIVKSKDFVTIYIKEGDSYVIAAGGCNTSAKAVRWVYKLTSKKWCTPKLIREFLDACGVSLHPCRQV